MDCLLQIETLFIALPQVQVRSEAQAVQLARARRYVSPRRSLSCGCATLHFSFCSLGKTLVAELLLLSRLAECKLCLPPLSPPSCQHYIQRRRIGLFVLPYVSVVNEKENYFRRLCCDIGAY